MTIFRAGRVKIERQKTGNIFETLKALVLDIRDSPKMTALEFFDKMSFSRSS